VNAFEDAGFAFSAKPYLHSSFPPGAGHELFLGRKP
jgi:hypothetical protein